MPLYSNSKRSRSGSTTSSSSSSSKSDDLENESKYIQNKTKSVARKSSKSNLTTIKSHTNKKSTSLSSRRTSKSSSCSDHHEIISDGSTESRGRTRTRYKSYKEQEVGDEKLTLERNHENEPHIILPEDDPKASRVLYIGNLHVDITHSKLHTILERYGNVLRIDIRPGKFGTERVYAFARFLTLDMAYNAKVALSGQFITKYRCKIGYGKNTPTARIWVGGLEPSTTKSQIKAEFRQFGEITRIDRIGGDRQAYIWYDSEQAAFEAARKMRGFSFASRLRTDFADIPPNEFENRPSTSEESHNSKNVELLKKCYTANDIIKNCSVVWQGDLILKSVPHIVAMHLIEGSKDIVREFMKKKQLIFSQKYNPSEFKIVEAQKGLSSGSSYAIFLGCPVESGTSSVRKLVSYLKDREAVGAVYLMNEKNFTYGILFIFPPCSFSIHLLKRNCPHLSEESITEDNLIMVALHGF